MYQKPLEHLETVILHQPHLVVIHAEAEGVYEFLLELDGLGIKRGVALLKDTPVSEIEPYLNEIEHILIFSGDLGHYGGSVDYELLEKVKRLKELKPELEIGWDGGVSEESAQKLAESGVDVLNVGGAIQKASAPEKAYDKLVLSIKNIKRVNK
jgi:ribulose-phosphate 3-epimerase